MIITKKPCCCDARVGSLTYGIIMSVISGLGLLVGIGFFFYMNFVMWFEKYYVDSSTNEYKYVYRPQSDMFILSMIIEFLCIVGLIFITMEFSFSVVLAYGASKRKPGHLEAYFVYGIVRTVIIVLKSVAVFMVLWSDAPAWLAVSVFYSCMNAMLLMMVYKARHQMLEERKGYMYNKFLNEVPKKV